MTLLFVFIFMTAAVLAALLIPLFSRQKNAARIDYDLAVYRDQLNEIEKDIAQGLLTKEQAGSVSEEIYRRMLAAEDSKKSTPRSSRKAQRVAAIIFLVVLPIGAWLLYSYLGNPELPGQPYAERQSQNEPNFIPLPKHGNLSINSLFPDLSQ